MWPDFEEGHFSEPFPAAYYMTLTILGAHLFELLIPGKWALPIIAGMMFWKLYTWPLRGGHYARAIRFALGWAGLMVVIQVTLSIIFPELMEQNVIRAASYRDEMFHWIATGEGAEGDIIQFLPIHLWHFVIFCVLSAATGGLLGLMMGAVLLGYMNFYVGSLIAAGGFSPVTFLLGWQIWAVVRVTGFIIAGTALGAVLVHSRGDRKKKKREIIRWMVVAVGLILADIVLKWALAGTYRQALGGVIGG